MDIAPESLVLLDDPRVRRIVAAWPTLGKRATGLDLMIAWADASGEPLSTVLKFGSALTRVQICASDGTIAPLAARYMASAALKGARK